MLTMLNPRVNFTLAAVSAVCFVYFALLDKMSVFTFLIGTLASFPIITHTWKVIEKNWKGLYKKFYSERFYRRDGKLVARSVKLTWWIVPWSIIIYSTINLSIIRLSDSVPLLLSFSVGSIFTIAFVSREKCTGFYGELCRGK